MKIKLEKETKTNTKLFGEIPIGTVFQIGSNTYIKTHLAKSWDSDENNTHKFNSMNLSTNYFVFFFDGDAVTPREATLVVKIEE